jgi:hypothetical protein
LKDIERTGLGRNQREKIVRRWKDLATFSSINTHKMEMMLEEDSNQGDKYITLP